jgi:hypothetical protein
MSEPSSLYLRVRLSEAALEAYKQSQPSTPSRYTDWQPWLVTKTYNGQITDADIAALNFANDKTCGAYVAAWSGDVYAGPAASHYDSATQTWTLVIAGCSENYREFIEILSVLRGVAVYKDVPGEDFILIYPYFWGGAPEAYLVLTQGASRFEQTIPPEALAEADARLQGLYDEVMASAPPDL